MRFHALHAPLALVVGVTSATSAQDAVPEAKIELVQVDVVVTDSRGKPVRDLAQQDFVVLEDGKPQRLSHFALAGRGATGVSAPAAAGAPAASPATPGRKIVLIVDDLHIASGNLAFTKQALKQLVAEFLASDDDVGLVTVSSSVVTQQPTRDRALLEQAVDRLSVREAAVAPARGSHMTPAQAELILRGDPSALQLAARTLMAEEPGGAVPPNSPQAAVDQPAGVQATGRDAMAQLMGSGNTSVPEKEARRQARAVLAESLRYSAATLGAVEEVLRSLRLFPGRKVCLLVSDGFLVGLGTDDERTKDLQRVLDAATRSGAVVYALDTRGLSGSGGDAAV
ncbi:MAG: VWA domain-containing protein, partial [Gaiellaceae bacterium]